MNKKYRYIDTQTFLAAEKTPFSWKINIVRKRERQRQRIKYVCCVNDVYIGTV